MDSLTKTGFSMFSKVDFKLAMTVWIIGDIGWITYDFFIDNLSHLVLSAVIISINLYGIYNIKKKKRKSV